MAYNKKVMKFDVTVNQPAATFWTAWVQDSHRTLPLAKPDYFSGIEYPEGRWGEAGSVRLVKYGKACSHSDYAKEKWEEVDHDNYFAKWKVVEGGALGKYFREQNNSMKIISGPDANSCVLQFSVEYDSIGEHKFHETYKQEMINSVRAVESYLKANPEYCCVSN